MASIFCENIHAKESVTSLCVFEKAKSATGVPLIFSTGRDGTYAAHEIRESADELQLTTVHQLSLPFGPNIEGMGFSVEEKLWVWGFRGKHFVVFDIGAQRETMSVDCGGVHRSWIFQPGVGGGTFIWTKASNLYVAHQHHLPFTSLRAGGHGREIKSVASSPTHSCLVATGGEDTDIKLSLYEGGEWRCLHTIQKHNTGIQHLQWSQDGNHLFSSGGFREFFVWRIRFDVPELHVGVVCQSAHPDSGTSDLRIMSFDVSDERPTGAFHIAMVYSDSTIRTWHYRAAEGWTLRTTGDYLTSCLTQCLRLAPGQMSTASTDGCVTRWREDGESRRIEWTSRHVLHQNAILSVLRCVGDDGSELCITGGDDNALGISRVDPTGRFDTLVIPRAHAAAVTGLAMVRRGPGQVYFASAGVDQRIKLWEVRLEVGNVGVDGIAVRLRRNVSTAVADVSGMEAVRLPDGSLGVLVCGVGMDVWRIESAFLDKSINW
jgi:WD40 repeat protein